MKRSFLFFFTCILFSVTAFGQIILQESFDGTTFPSAGWYNTRMAPSFSTALNLWDRVTSGSSPSVTPHSGAGMARFNSLTATSNTETELGTIALNFSGTSRYRIRFWMFRSDAVNAFDQLDVYVATAQSAVWGPKIGSVSVNTGRTPAETGNGWYEYVYDVPSNFNYASVYVIFRAVGKIGLPVYIDDVVVETIVCHKPLSPAATANGSTTAALSWMAPATGTASGYEWEVRSAGSAGTGATGLVQSGTTTGDMTATVAGLTAGSNYKFYVRSVCGSDKSTWTDAITFKTQCTPSSIPYIENFDGDLTTISTCTNIENVNGGYAWNINAGVNYGVTAPSSPNVAVCMFGGGTLPQDDWFYSAPLQLEAGKCYELYFSHRSLYSNYLTSFEVKIGNSPKSTSMSSSALFSRLSFIDVNFKTGTATFTVAQNGVYFIGFHHIGSDGGSIVLDDIGVRENLGQPVDIIATPLVSSATLNWNAPACGTATDYEWELRTSGAPGSGSTGLLKTGSGNVLTTTFTGLNEAVNYSFYIRSKGGAFTSVWSNAVDFQTKCTIRTLPYSENFDAVTEPAKPSCILTDNPVGGNPWVNVGNSLPHTAPNCMRIQYNSPSGNQLDGWFFTPPFNLMAGKSYRLTFWYRAHIVYSTEKLEVKYGLGAKAAVMTSAPLFYNNALKSSFYQQHVVDFVPSATGDYNIGFHGFSGPGGNDYIRIDDITVSETPACDTVRDAKAINISTTSATINWLAPLSGVPSGYDWELRTSGAAGSGSAGRVQTGTSSTGTTSLSVTGLSTATAYQFYIRSSCGVQTGDWVQVNFSSACAAATIPYTENFDAVTAPQLPQCVKEEDKADDAKWLISNNAVHVRSAPNSMWHNFNPWSPVDDWFFTAPLQLQAGKLYRIAFYYKAESATYSEALEIKLATFANVSATIGTALYSASNLKSTTYQQVFVDFVVPADGVYHLGFHSFSSYSQGGIYIDDMSVVETITTAVRDNVQAGKELLQNIYPNPVDASFMLKVNRQYDAGKMIVRIRDMQGRLVQSAELNLGGNENYRINTESLTGGMYLLETIHLRSGKKQTISMRKK